MDRAEGSLGAEAGGGGGAARGIGVMGGGRGADAGVGGGAGGGGGAPAGGSAGSVGGAAEDGFLAVIGGGRGFAPLGGGGGGFAPLGGGGGARGGRSELDRRELSVFGLWAGLGGGLRRFATSGLAAEGGCGGDDSIVCGVGLNTFSLGAVGGFGAEEAGGLGAELLEISGPGIYDESRSAPVSTPPPVFFSFGMPTPAKIPPNCGAVFAPPPPPVSLLLLPRLKATPLGSVDARPIGGFPRPGTAGAPPMGRPADISEVFPTMGAERSFVTAFLSLVPFVMSVRRAPLLIGQCRLS